MLDWLAMSPAGIRRSWFAARGSALAAAAATLLVVVLVFAAILLASPARADAAAAGALSVVMDRSLTLVDENAAFTVSGDYLGTLSPGATIQVTIAGPASLSQLTQADPALPQVGDFIIAVDSLPALARPSATQFHLPIPVASLPVLPGAYRVTVTVGSGGVSMATGGTWMGRVAMRTSPLDLAFVWRMTLGIHRDSQGRFVDTTLEQACAPGGALPALAGLSSRFPDWRFSLGIEPVLLAQLRDMSDGFTRVDGSQAGVQVSADEPTAKNAKAVLSSLADLAGSDRVEIATGSYADADLGLLATQDWRDGFEQIQLGKQELVDTLGLGLPPAGAFSSDLDLASDCIGDYGQASIDHVLVDDTVAADLNEKVDPGTVAVRVHDNADDRVTLVLADSDLRALMTSPWDPSVLFAGIAAVLASGDRDALVLTPAPEFALPPQSYLDAIGNEIEQDTWIRTETMSDLLRAHPPGTRPVLLNRSEGLPSDYITQTIFAAIQSSHAAVDDLAAGADPASLSLDAARRSLYIAESRWWFRQGVSPDEASAGLAYALQAEEISRGEMGKIDLAGVKSPLVFGHDAEATLAVKNGTDAVVTVEVHLSGDGLRFPKGDAIQVRLEPGSTSITIPVVSTSSSRKLTVRLLLGKTTLAEQTASLRFLTVMDILPWAGIGVLAAILIVLIVLLVRAREGRRRR